MAPTGHVDLMQRELDSIAWEFLGSEFTGQIYAGWPIDQRLDAYLLHRGLIAVANDGTACNALLDRVMANIGRALRNGLLGPSAN
jgi:hypothetical protein